MSLDSNFFLVLSFSNQWFFQTGFEKNQAKKIKKEHWNPNMAHL